MPKPDLHQYSLSADEDESVPAPPPPKGNTVQGKPRNFLPYAPSWAKHPDYDRVKDLAMPACNVVIVHLPNLYCSAWPHPFYT
jgi:hypothetical protein